MASTALAFEDYSLYSNLSDEELLSLAIERSLGSDTQPDCLYANANPRANPDPPDPPASNTILSLAARRRGPQAAEHNPQHNPQPPPAHAYSSPNPPTGLSLAARRRGPQAAAHNPPPAHLYSSPNPPCEKPPDPKTFDGTISRFMTGSGKRIVAYRDPSGRLVFSGPEPEEEEEEPLFKAIQDGDVKTVKTLMTRSGTNLMMPSKPGWLAIHQAAWYGQEACLRELLSAQPGMVNKRTERGETALMVAVNREKLECVQVLLERGADIDTPNYDKETPLYKACERNDASIVAALLSRGAAVNTHCIQGWTALQEAAGKNNVEICEMLLKAGAKHNLKNMYGISPLFTAAQSGNMDALRFLLKHGADIDTQASDGATALYEAAKNGHEDIVEFLLSQNADANKPGKTGLLPLHITAQHGNDNMVSMLVRCTGKARVWRSGISPLHLAAERNRDNVLELLVAAGFDVNALLSTERSKLYEDRRRTPLYFSVINNNLAAVQLLLAAGASPNLDLLSPLMVAARMGCMDTVRLLVEHGAEVNAAIPTRPTAFPAVYMFAMKTLPMFKYLLDHGGHALSCFSCCYGNGPHPPIKTPDSEREVIPDTQGPDGLQFCEMVSQPGVARWAGPIVDVLLDYVGHVSLCHRLKEHLDSYSGWSDIRDKAAPPRSLLQLCRLQVVRLAGFRRVKKLDLPGGLIRFLEHRERETDNF